MIETAELRVLRQSLMRIRALGVVSQPLESPFLGGLDLACVLALRSVWVDERMTLPRVVALSDWIWHNLAPSPLDWIPAARDPERVTAARESFAYHVALLINSILLVRGERQDMFRDWVERIVLQPLLPANGDLVDAIATRVGTEIESLSQRLTKNASLAAS